ncbi:cellulase family glycosylhydrolase [Epilithonimonas pallida]|uniref:Carbohydrate binding module (Family 6) n=1 Tax=Epilithonimonas pallida TaxID=373671 RepID=A0ABY1R4M1_9FLAO|nr:cellulase family glycosylhydrolase [Epilithonimonas pallida]SMP95429.1 Carbohydrate binding module (family 6) [Epilithonimonas pallida]
MLRTAVFCTLLLSQFGTAQGFLKTQGQKIVNSKGENVYLKGLGLGGWMLQEGYMLKTADFAGPQYQIKEKIAEVAGEDGKDEFYKAYLKNGITKKDIDSLAKWGFNSIRLPMHYNLYTLPIEKEPVKGQNTWLEEGFQMTDNLLKWCEDNKIYLILDLHAAPGGQGNDANISDNDKSKPNLWQSEENQKKTVALWKKLAERYKDKEWIGGYDLINEPNYPFTGKNPNGTDEMSNAPLWKLQKDITEAIRQVDKKHIIILEGNGWGNNYNGLPKLWDDNLVLSFHKYWTTNSQDAIQNIIDLREKLNVPAWLGETGENSNVWFTELNQLLLKNNIGYAYWPMKKIDNIAGVTNVKITPDYQKLLNYWKNGGTKPTKDFAKKALMKIADNYKLENVEVKKDVIDALFRQVNDDTTKPYKNHAVPGRIFATEYDLGRFGSAYSDNDFQNLWVSNGTHTEWNSGNKMRNDGVDIYACNDKITNKYYVGKTEKGEWLQYTVNSNLAKKYKLNIRYNNESTQASELFIKTENGDDLGSIKLVPTGKAWKTVSVNNINLVKGENKLRLYFEAGNANLNYFELQ